MPCYDKKLEAVRPYGKIQATEDISDPSTINEVDAVIATHELADLFHKHGIDIKAMLSSVSEDSSQLTVGYSFDTDLTEEERKIENSVFYSSGNLYQASNGYASYIIHRFANHVKQEFSVLR